MRRTFMIIMFTTLSILLGQLLINNASTARHNNFLNKKVFKDLEEGNVEEFIDGVHLAMGIPNYYKDPLYTFSGEDDFKIKIYISENKQYRALLLFIENVKLKDDAIDINVNITTTSSDKTINNYIYLNRYDYKLNSGIFIPMLIDKKDETIYFEQEYDKLVFRGIESIEFSYAYSKDSEKEHELFARIDSNDHYEVTDKNVSSLEKKGNVLYSKEFNGLGKKYVQEDFLKDKFEEANLEVLKPYNKPLTLTIVIYTIVVVLSFLYILFRDKIHGLFKKEEVSKV